MNETASEKATLFVEVTRDPESVTAAQRLRYEIFAEEMGACLPSAASGLDVDHHDPHCSHLLVREGRGGRVVACARLIDSAGALAAGGFYSQQEFDLSPVLTLPGGILEVGRVCIAKARRDGTTLSTMWSALAREALDKGVSHLIGCASVPFDPRTEALTPLAESLRAYWLPDSQRVHPRRRVPEDPATPARNVALPPLLAAYLRIGAKIGGPPSWDPDFKTGDFFVLVSVEKIAARYARRFLDREASACAS